MALFDQKNLQQMEREEEGLSKRIVLLVDDEEHNLTTLKYALAPHYDVLTALDGHDALEFLKKEPDPTRIHVIISDQRMPKMTGVDFLTRSIEIIPRAIRIILTGFTDLEAILDSINQARIYKFILKPFDEDDIFLTIKRGLELYDLEEKNQRLVETLEFFNSKLFSHLRGILQNVFGSTELLVRASSGGQTEDQKKLLEQVGSSTEDLIALLNRASELSYVYTGNRRVRKEQLEIVSLVREVGEAFSAGIPASELTLDFELNVASADEEDAPGWYIEADPELVSKALLEVLQNGFIYAEKPTRITIGTAVRDNYFCINVRDQGIGLGDERGEELMKPFVRGIRAAEFQPFGFGIGLANAKAFLEANDGNLFLLREKKGSTVLLTLPLAEFSGEEPILLDTSPRRIAIQEESPEELELLRKVLEFQGHEVSGFASPEGLLDSLLVSTPDLILMEEQYHGKSTESAVRKIAGTLWEFPPRVVILAADPTPSGEQEFLDWGAHSCVAKPIGYGQLMALLQES